MTTIKGGKMEALAVKDSREVARPLKVLVPLIQGELKAADEAGLEHRRAAGVLLLEAKDQVVHGEWGSWLKRNFTMTAHTARTYMHLAATFKGESTLPFRTFSDFVRPQGQTPRMTPPAWHEPVRESIATFNVKRMLEERENKEKEEKLLRALGLQLIDIGYKVLATKLHPDKGGTAEGMARLTRVRDILKRAL